MGTFQRTVLITGGATGIGLASAHAFSKAGYNVVLTDLEQKVVQDVNLLLVIQEVEVHTMLIVEKGS